MIPEIVSQASGERIPHIISAWETMWGILIPAFRIMAYWENPESGRDEYCPYHFKGERLICR